MPKVSIVVPNYNHGRYLPRRLDSIFGQTFQDFEVTVVDDASRDDSIDVLRRYEHDPRLRLILNSINSGSPFKSWNAGARASVGEFLWIAESDDYADPRFLEHLVPRLERSPSIGMVYCRSYMVGEHDEVLGTDDALKERLFGAHWSSDYQARGRDEIADYLVFRNTIPNASAVLLRRERFEGIGFAPEEMTLAGDWLTWVRILLDSDIAYSAQPLNYFRRHPDTVRQRLTGRVEEIEESCRIIHLVLSAMNLERSKIEEIQDFLVEKWWATLRNHPRELLSRKNISVYRLASRQDPRLRSRIAKKILAKFLHPSRRRSSKQSP